MQTKSPFHCNYNLFLFRSHIFHNRYYRSVCQIRVRLHLQHYLQKHTGNVAKCFLRLQFSVSCCNCRALWVRQLNKIYVTIKKKNSLLVYSTSLSSKKPGETLRKRKKKWMPMPTQNPIQWTPRRIHFRVKIRIFNCVKESP